MVNLYYQFCKVKSKAMLQTTISLLNNLSIMAAQASFDHLFLQEQYETFEIVIDDVNQ